MKTITYCHIKAMVSYCFTLMLVLLVASYPLQAQEKENFQAEIATDLVSQNIWRGVYQSGAGMQPSLACGYKNFELYVWGTTDFQSTEHEIDFTLSYTFRGFTIGITDYWCGDNTSNYFDNHQFEGSFNYTFDNAPISLGWNTVFSGEEQPRAFSSYAEVNYLLELSMINFDFSLGFTPWKNQMLETDKFSITNISISAGKQVLISSEFAILTSCILLYNPVADRLYFVAKIGLTFSKF